MGWGKKCSNCRQNPCTPSCAVGNAASPLHNDAGKKLTGGQRPDSGRQATERQRREDAAYRAIRDAPPKLKIKPNLRYLPKDKARVVQEMRAKGIISKMQNVGEYIQVELKPGHEHDYTEYDGHQR